MFGVTANNKMSAVAGLVIGATLTMCHLIGIPSSMVHSER
mgnify:FL=1